MQKKLGGRIRPSEWGLVLVPVGATDGNMKGDAIKGSRGETSSEARANQGFKYPTWDTVQYSHLCERLMCDSR